MQKQCFLKVSDVICSPVAFHDSSSSLRASGLVGFQIHFYSSGSVQFCSLVLNLWVSGSFYTTGRHRWSSAVILKWSWLGLGHCMCPQKYQLPERLSCVDWGLAAHVPKMHPCHLSCLACNNLVSRVNSCVASRTTALDQENLNLPVSQIFSTL